VGTLGPAGAVVKYGKAYWSGSSLGHLNPGVDMEYRRESITVAGEERHHRV
jgi:hypothetical protein